MIQGVCQDLGMPWCPRPVPGMPCTPVSSLLHDTSECDFLPVSLRQAPGIFARFWYAAAVPGAGSELAQNQFWPVPLA